VNGNATVECKYTVQTISMYIYNLLTHHFNWESNEYSQEIGAYFALKGHFAQALGDHLD
jgi:hypothetical protein